MTREIKFRAWDKRFKLMLPVFCLFWRNDGSIMDISLRRLGSNQEQHPNKDIENMVLMQFTGLKDKNGKDVYEGDIVRLIERGGYIKATGNIAWRNARYYLQRGSEEDLSLFSPTYPENLEIIGNIYENPELLK